MFQPIYKDESEIAHYPEDVQVLIRNIQAEQDKRYNDVMENYARSEVREGGGVAHLSKDGVIMEEQVGYFFSLSYASWLCLPRVALQEMPLDWQVRLVALMEEGYARGLTCPDNVSVVRKKNGKFVNNDHWNNYRRGNTRHAKEVDTREGIEDWSEDRG